MKRFLFTLSIILALPLVANAQCPPIVSSQFSSFSSFNSFQPSFASVNTFGFNAVPFQVVGAPPIVFAQASFVPSVNVVVNNNRAVVANRNAVVVNRNVVRARRANVVNTRQVVRTRTVVR